MIDIKVGDRIRILADEPHEADLWAGDTAEVVESLPYGIYVQDDRPSSLHWWLADDTRGILWEEI